MFSRAVLYPRLHDYSIGQLEVTHRPGKLSSPGTAEIGAHVTCPTSRTSLGVGNIEELVCVCGGLASDLKFLLLHIPNLGMTSGGSCSVCCTLEASFGRKPCETHFLDVRLQEPLSDSALFNQAGEAETMDPEHPVTRRSWWRMTRTSLTCRTSRRCWTRWRRRLLPTRIWCR